MGGNLTPIPMREFDKHDEDATSQELLMKSPKSDVNDFDSEGIPQFLARISEAKVAGSLSAERAISICEDLARVYGPNIAPQIDNIMSTIINCLMSNSESITIKQACSKVVLSIARYAIDPLATADKKNEIISSICRPLSDSLLGSNESLASGAALCLQALLDSDNWGYASDEIVNDICMNVSAALEEKPTQTDAHMGLVMVLAKHNTLTIEAYTRLLIRTGLRILNIGVIEGDSLKQLSAIQMVNFLMKCVDTRSILTELENVAEEMENCYADIDQLSSVKHAAFEALQTARAIICNRCSRVEKDSGSETCSNFFRSSSSGRIVLYGTRDRSPVSVSTEWENVDSFDECESLSKPPLSPGQLSCNFDYTSGSVNRNMWENGSNDFDVSSKDRLCTCTGLGCNRSKTHSEHFKVSGISKNRQDHLDAFSRFGHSSQREKITRSATPIPERPSSQFNVNDIDILATPICTVQDPDVNLNFSMKQTTRIRNRASRCLEDILAKEVDGNCGKYMFNHVRIPESRKQAPGSKSVSPIDDVASSVVGGELKNEIQSPKARDKSFMRSVFNSVCCLLVILSIFTLLVTWLDDQEVGFDVAPT